MDAFLPENIDKLFDKLFFTIPVKILEEVRKLKLKVH